MPFAAAAAPPLFGAATHYYATLFIACYYYFVDDAFIFIIIIDIFAYFVCHYFPCHAARYVNTTTMPPIADAAATPLDA